MCDMQTNVRFTWQLVSQFVSWEFCRYTSEQNENSSPETDVLTFIRNMIVQRTEKSPSDITKHEIIAKFLMETKAIQNISRMPCIIALSESVKKICPELEQDVIKLVHHLETFLNVLDSSDECRKALIQLRIDDAVNDFSKEAERLLPPPDLLQVVEAWNHLHDHLPVHKPIKKATYNAMLFEKALECLYSESITPSEAKLIAVSLYEDKVFEKILLYAEAEPETEADSEQFSLSVQSSQPNEHVYSQEFCKNAQLAKTDGIHLNQIPPTTNSLQLDSPIHEPEEFPVLHHESHEEPPQLSLVQAHAISPPSQPSPVNQVLHGNISAQNRSYQTTELHNNVTDNNMEFAQSSANDSPSELTPALHERINKKINIINYQRTQNLSDSDTSDCEKNPQYKFLTPTLYKNNTDKVAPSKSQVVWLSDSESNDSSVVTFVINSQQDDPNWSVQKRFKPVASSVVANKKVFTRSQTQVLWSSDSDDNSAVKPLISNDPNHSSGTRISNTPTSIIRERNKKGPLKKKVGWVLSSDSSESIHDSLIENEGNLLHRLQQQPSTSATQTNVELERPAKKKRGMKSVQLYRSPNVSMHDFITRVRKPAPFITSEVPVHRGTNTPSTSKKSSKPRISSGRNHKCKQCSRTYKTAVSLRRHVFLKHTDPPDDSDCD